MTTVDTCRSLYVHVPFCRTICGYCDFYSQRLNVASVPPLVDALLAELERGAGARGFRFATLYVGGGTPTVLPIGELQRLVTGLNRYMATADAPEFTVEANPATVADEVADVLAVAGVNRVSVGAQSFDPAELETLERSHRVEEVSETVAVCRRHGLSNISLDLIFGIPGQTLDSWRRSLEAALALDPRHLSCYALTYEADTPLARRRAAGQVASVDEDLEADMFELALDMLPAAGWAHYEISNFARPGYECRHNLGCWDNAPYLGVGPAAAGYLDGVRYQNVADTAAYVEAMRAGRAAWAEQERLTGERRAREAAMLALRTHVGVDRGRFVARYGCDPLALFADVIQKHVGDGRLQVDDAGFRLTRAGLLVADTVMADFL